MTSLGERIAQARAIKGLSQSELARRVGLRPQSIQAIESGKAKGSKHVVEIAKALGVTPDYLQSGAIQKHSDLPKTDNSPATFQALPYPFSGSRDLPVLGAAKGGFGGTRFMENGEVFEYIDRPSDLVGVNGAYAAYVVGDSMSPRYQHGEMVLVNPNKPVGAGNFVIVQFWNEDASEREYTIKLYVRRDTKRLKLNQFNPAAEIDIPADRIIAVHRIIGSRETT